jgi:4-hydroxybenzoate adenylyltransferase
MNVAGVLEKICARRGWAPHPAFATASGDYSHGEVHAVAAQWATVLRKHGVGQGDRVLIVLPDDIDFVLAFLATTRLGGLAVLVDPSAPAASHRALANDLSVGLVLCEENASDRFGGLALATTRLHAEAPAAAPAAAAACDDSAPAYVQLTSGTSGPPKAAVHRHRDLLAYQRAFGAPVLGLRPEESVLSVSKLFFAYGFGNSLVYPLLSGCRAVLHRERPTPAAIAELVAAHQVAVLFAVPSFYARLLADEHAEALRGLRLAITAGEPLPARVDGRFAQDVRVPLLDGLGSTEVGQTFCSNTTGTTRRATVGRALPPYRVRVVDHDGRPAAPGAQGTLQVSGPSTLAGYLDRADDLYDGEWLRTNDLASLDDDGFVYLSVRLDDLEIVGGVKVCPAPFEEALGDEPSVAEVAVCSVPDERGAARLVCFVVPDGDGGPDLAERLLRRAARVAASVRPPREVVFLDELPRTATGKLMRHRLRRHENAA